VGLEESDQLESYAEYFTAYQKVTENFIKEHFSHLKELNKKSLKHKEKILSTMDLLLANEELKSYESAYASLVSAVEKFDSKMSLYSLDRLQRKLSPSDEFDEPLDFAILVNKLLANNDVRDLIVESEEMVAEKNKLKQINFLQSSLKTALMGTSFKCRLLSEEEQKVADTTFKENHDLFVKLIENTPKKYSEFISFDLKIDASFNSFLEIRCLSQELQEPMDEIFSEVIGQFAAGFIEEDNLKEHKHYATLNIMRQSPTPPLKLVYHVNLDSTEGQKFMQFLVKSHSTLSEVLTKKRLKKIKALVIQDIEKEKDELNAKYQNNEISKSDLKRQTEDLDLNLSLLSRKNRRNDVILASPRFKEFIKDRIQSLL